MRSSSSSRRVRRWFRPLVVERLEVRLNPGFLDPLTFSAGHAPRSVAVGEFNGDGLADVVVANWFPRPGTVSVLLGNGNGSFQEQRSFTAGNSPSSVAVGDMNGDGYSDVAVSNQDDDTVSVLLGVGDGSLQAARHFPVADIDPYALAVADLNGDGVPDLAASGPFGLSVLLGDGDGSFQLPWVLRIAGFSLTVGDVNADGVLDLATSFGNKDGGFVNVLLGNGDGTFQPLQRFDGQDNAVAMVDVNLDGFLDLISANYYVKVQLGNGDGSFQPEYHFFPVGSQAAMSMSLEDLNADGIPDITVATFDYDGTRDNVSVFLGNGDGSFQDALNFRAGRDPRSVAVGDVNGDGWLDLTVANYGARDVSVLLNDGAWAGPIPAPDDGQSPHGGKEPTVLDGFAAQALAAHLTPAALPAHQDTRATVELPLPARRYERPTPALTSAAAGTTVNPQRVLDHLFGQLAGGAPWERAPSW